MNQYEVTAKLRLQRLPSMMVENGSSVCQSMLVASQRHRPSVSSGGAGGDAPGEPGRAAEDGRHDRVPNDTKGQQKMCFVVCSVLGSLPNLLAQLVVRRNCE
jgi:hypothetical protein